MKIVEVRTAAGLQELRPAWEALLEESASATIFLTWEWVTAWWEAYGAADEMEILLAYDDAGTLRGIAPLRRSRMKRYGRSVETLSFMGDDSWDSDYLDFISARGHEKAVMEAFGARLAGRVERGVVLRLNEIPEGSPNLEHLRKWAHPGRPSAGYGQAGRPLGPPAPPKLWRESATPCGTVRLPDTWDEYLKVLRPRFRTKVRSVLRDLEGRPGVKFGFCQSAEEAARHLEPLFDLHTRRWISGGQPGVFHWEAKREFYRRVSPLLAGRGRLRFSWLEWNGRVLACQYGFTYGATYFQLQEGYEPASEHWNAGIGLRAWSIRRLMEEGVREYDFLGGMGRHKSDWGAETKQSVQVLAARSTPANLLFCRGPEWETRAREAVAGMLPEKLLEARRQRLVARRGAALTGPARNGAGRHALRSAAARCYLHLGLPALARRFRERYQVTLSPAVSCRKRTGASVRILYYHRVNDDRDPFFPAMPTDVFEAQMRYVARHHKVVPLAEAFDRLASGSPESVVTITFDDGYQDNYHNAFPILERYRLPAAIFLATGSLDSGEPLWFETLADAVKHSAREFVDVEIDLPRRFWMRTPAERLEANGRIFSLLRTLPDASRREWLERIVRYLEVESSRDRHNKMLTWDQVRHLNERRIDFGGHTVTHPFLSKVAPETAVWEIGECKRRIEEELQAPVAWFAYPNGRQEDFAGDTKQILQQAGYQAALTTIWGVNYGSTDRLELRRGGPWEENLALFASKLDWYQLVNR
jgi:peptidoglycan/xylan/chitin deacetylase (PgdA/CDA1 family)/CelD/BcsL family acetyltransferase involved in cellulose biosynthesis